MIEGSKRAERLIEGIRWDGLGKAAQIIELFLILVVLILQLREMT